MQISEIILKAVGDKKSLTYKGRNIRLAADRAAETWQVRKGWHDIFRALSEKDMQPRILHPTRLSFRIGELMSFQITENLIKLALKEILKGIL